MIHGQVTTFYFEQSRATPDLDPSGPATVYTNQRPPNLSLDGGNSVPLVPLADGSLRLFRPLDPFFFLFSLGLPCL